MLKRCFDFIAAFLGLIILSPLFLVVAVWIKVDSPGDIFFRQIRIGLQGCEFQIYKFRTMVTDAEALGKQITVGDDQRITRSGRFLRKFKLDELPQLLNVLRGDMSLVGPRPEVPRYVALYTPEQRKVLEVRPGITDPASIAFRNESDLLAIMADPEAGYIQEVMPKKLELNLQYLAQSPSLWNDLQIIFNTLERVISD